MESNTAPFSAETLAEAGVLVIANALNARNAAESESDGWTTPAPPALEGDEIPAVVEWVEQGGSLLLVADHMPFPGAITNLALQFGVVWENAFAFAGNFTFAPGDPNLIQFRLGTPGPTGGIAFDHALFRGRSSGEAVPFVSSFTGSAFRTLPGSNVVPVMQLGGGPSSLVAYPTNHLDITVATPMGPATGLLQGGVLEYGQGRVAFMAEAAMFAARKADFVSPGFDMGMSNQELAPHNKQFTLNLLHWLSGIIDWDIPTAVQREAALPGDHRLERSWPNPFNPQTHIQYNVAQSAHVELSVYNLAGQLVRTLVEQEQAPGAYTVAWDATDDVGNRLAAGVYLYRMQAGEYTASGKMTLVP